MLGSTLGTRVETSSCVSIVALIGKGYKLVLLTSWVSFLNNLTLSVIVGHSILGDGRSAMQGSEVR